MNRLDDAPTFILNRLFGQLVASPLEIRSWVDYPSQLIDAFIDEAERLAMPHAAHDTPMPTCTLTITDPPNRSKKRKLGQAGETPGGLEEERTKTRPSESWALIKRPKLTVSLIPKGRYRPPAKPPRLRSSHLTLSPASSIDHLPYVIDNRSYWESMIRIQALGSHVPTWPRPPSCFLHPGAPATLSVPHVTSPAQTSFTPGYRSDRLITYSTHWHQNSPLGREAGVVIGPAVTSPTSIRATDDLPQLSTDSVGPDRQEQTSFTDDDHCMAPMDDYDPLHDIFPDYQTPSSSDAPSNYLPAQLPPAVAGSQSSVHRVGDQTDEDVFEPDNERQNVGNNQEGENLGAGQWRVGKTPGHQGSHSRSVKASTGREDGGFNAGHKRSLSQSIAGAATRVLKKPFRPPSRVVLQKTTSAPSSPFSDSSTRQPSTPSSSERTVVTDTPARGIKNTPPATRIRSAKLARPFRTPLRSSRSNAPSPVTVVQAAPSSPYNPGPPQTGQAALTALQNEVLMLKKAIRYDAQDSAGRLQELIVMWRSAGREMVEKLYDLIPRPDPGTSDNPYISNPTPSGYWQESSASNGLSSEQEEILAKAPRNKDGDPVDADGNLLIPDVADQDMGALMKEIESSTLYGDQVKGNGRFHEKEETPMCDRRDRIAEDPMVWNYGTVLRGLGVDPPLFGWNTEAEDWD
ncbi:hypothetical protein L198_04464 [Cryptococcus wingfieldii CBS 7118]|uniref:Swi5-dependent recombination DNA repair protein 1 n=1 Tax=Cryptococcus wingfieldii CBS 7118 TaxID=1295528 RepID=A0A1E3J6W7_9TREE|nr:hypothetical protein L198_04464 [Cryptococcus wingfieldii CBS 7118]ODN95846.1 hypothetical protein L198_04464 [Cryptococcus wingfieldii CBS 7118]